VNTNSRSYNSSRNLIMSIVQKVVSILLTFVSRQIFLKVLTVEYLGINGLFVNILSMLSLADLGLATAMSYSFYKPLAEKDEYKLAALIGFYKKVYNIIAIVVATAGLALTPFLRHIINLENEIRYIEIYYLIALSNTVVSYLFVYKATIISADQNSSIVTKYGVWIAISGTILQIITLLTVGSYMLYSSVSILWTFAYNIMLSRKAGKLYPFIKRKEKLRSEDKRDIFNNIKSIFIYKVSGVIYNGTDSIFISALISTAIVGKLDNYGLAVSNLSAIAFIIFTSLTPSIGNLIATESPEKRMQVFKIMQTASYWLAGFFCFCLFFLMDDFVILWLGREFIFDIATKVVILLNFYLTITLYPIIAFREATGIYQKTKYVMVAAAALKITLSVTLGIYFGLTGIISSTIISKLLTYAWYEPKVLFRDFLGGRAITYLFGHLQNLVMLSGCTALAFFLFPWKESSGWLAWILKGAVYTLSINAVYFLRYFKSPEFRDITSKITRLVMDVLKPTANGKGNSAV